MSSRRDLIRAVPVAGAALVLAEAAVPDRAVAQAAVPELNGWHSPSLVEATVTGPNGAVTARAALDANIKLGALEKSAVEVAPGVWLLSGWGLGHSMAVQATEGWIIVDTGDSTRAAAEMRAKLEEAVGGKIKVAAILLTHWHYADGTAAWMDEGAEVWGHEWLDANRNTSSGVSVKAGFYQARAMAQFGVLHPTEGPDAFPNKMGFTLDKLLGESSYRPPTRLFTHGKIETFTIAGEEVEVAPNRSDTSDSVGFYFPARRTWITNFMVQGFIFNIYTLRGGPFRNPLPWLQDNRWIEQKDAEVLLDLHSAPLIGAENVRAAVQRSMAQVQIIHDQTLRMIARGMDAREAAEAVYMPAALREGWETYGQVESHVRQIYNGTVGWFGNDVYEINPLSLHDEAAQMAMLAGGVDQLRKAASDAAAAGGIGNWQWALKLTSALLRLAPQDAVARQARAVAARALGQRTNSANARGFYITEALEMEGALSVAGKPVTMALVRAGVGTPSKADLVASPAEVSLEFLRYMVDPAQAEGKTAEFTVALAGVDATHRVILRNSVMVVEGTASKANLHLQLTPEDLADLILGNRSFAAVDPVLADFEASLDRSHLLLLPGGLGQSLNDPHEQERLTALGEQ
jgi:alkyl sulfatase BDS1-like metallo-beta-lactamase superfamily hydrolase